MIITRRVKESLPGEDKVQRQKRTIMDYWDCHMPMGYQKDMPTLQGKQLCIVSLSLIRKGGLQTTCLLLFCVGGAKGYIQNIHYCQSSNLQLQLYWIIPSMKRPNPEERKQIPCLYPTSGHPCLSIYFLDILTHSLTGPTSWFGHEATTHVGIAL